MSEMRCLQPPTGRAAEAAAAAPRVVPERETARLRLRAPRVEDCPLWTEIWQGADHISGLTDEHRWEEFCVYVAGWLIHGHGLWSVELKETGAHIGFVLLGVEWEDDAPEIGWAFAPDMRNRGFATEAAEAARDYAMELLGPSVVVSYIAETNAASARVAEKIGARRLANFDETTRVYGHGARPHGTSQKDLTE
ncbi:MAG: GNAT family N-acetyltransferase [Pseudomonadota bacterium]